MKSVSCGASHSIDKDGAEKHQQSKALLLLCKGSNAQSNPG